jgi:hypothetical protein
MVLMQQQVLLQKRMAQPAQCVLAMLALMNVKHANKPFGD